MNCGSSLTAVVPGLRTKVRQPGDHLCRRQCFDPCKEDISPAIEAGMPGALKRTEHIEFLSGQGVDRFKDPWLTSSLHCHLTSAYLTSIGTGDAELHAPVRPEHLLCRCFTLSLRQYSFLEDKDVEALQLEWTIRMPPVPRSADVLSEIQTAVLRLVISQAHQILPPVHVPEGRAHVGRLVPEHGLGQVRIAIDDRRQEIDLTPVLERSGDDVPVSLLDRGTEHVPGLPQAEKLPERPDGGGDSVVRDGGEVDQEDIDQEAEGQQIGRQR